ncbi:hypothetical protein NDN16_10455 [Aureimonas altamirensis]|uniref:hypothetical protein n=1 Tax=Aureimonas altamirensis TaxID=370622 RepID=UPI0020375DA8|nr:hypothetical protein [Aureimonas altamirensis]MCM2504092.1 hypothetical protein [Aureimonas altamirensis]
MTRLAWEAGALQPGAESLLPTMRAALRLARDYDDFAPLFRAIAEGSVTVISRVMRECAISPGALPLFPDPDKSLAVTLSEHQPLAFELLAGLLGVDTNEQPESSRPASKHAKPTRLIEHYEYLFGFATGILKWTPAQTYAATPGEIIAAFEFRQKAYASKDDKDAAKDAHAKLTLNQQAIKAFAGLGARVVKRTKPDAE